MLSVNSLRRASEASTFHPCLAGVRGSRFDSFSFKARRAVHGGVFAATSGGSSGNVAASSASPSELWHLLREVEKFSAIGIRPMTLKRLIGLPNSTRQDILWSAGWVRAELPVRIAHRLYDFHRLPFFVLCCPALREVHDLYLTSFERLRHVPPITDETSLQSFRELLEVERQTHDSSVDLMGQGLQQLRRVCRDFRIDAFLERFFYFRIGRRIMIDNLLAMQRTKPGWRGVVNTKCRPAEIIKARAREVQEACRFSYGLAPNVSVSGNLETEFATIPDHLALIVTEILKNALRATVEFYTLGNSILDSESKVGLIATDDDLPEVKVEVYKGQREVLIKISDKGGGVPPHKLKAMWSFGYCLRCLRKLQYDLLRPRAGSKDEGFGLPLARAFARYFGGDISVQSHFGVGTDVHVSLNHIGNKEEALFFEERPDLRLDGAGQPLGK